MWFAFGDPPDFGVMKFASASGAKISESTSAAAVSEVTMRRRGLDRKLAKRRLRPVVARSESCLKARAFYLSGHLT